MKAPIVKNSILSGLTMAAAGAVIAFIWTGHDGDHGGFDDLIIWLVVGLVFVCGSALTAATLIAISKQTPHRLMKILGIILLVAVILAILHITHFIG